MTLKISAALLTWNQYRTGRHELFKSTLYSLRSGFPYSLDVLTNGSTDRTDLEVLTLGGTVDNTNSACWYGMQRCIELALSHEPDIVVFSADDITYKDGWHERLIDFWQHAPDDIKLASLFIEPEWTQWNRVTEAHDIGSERVLIRDSVPGASWSFRASDTHLVLPIPTISPGEDLEVSRRIRAAGYRLAQLDLASHDGEAVSAWGNRSHLRSDMIPAHVVKAKWGI